LKRFLIFTGLLIAGFALLNLVFMGWLGKYDLEFLKVKEAHSFTNQSINCLVLGNSTAMDGINTSMLETSRGSAYNFSVGGATLKTNFIQLQTYLEKNRNPDRVFICLSSAHMRYVPTEEVNPTVGHYYGITDISALPLFTFRWLFTENIKKLFSSDHRSTRIARGQYQTSRTIPDPTSFREGVVSDSGYGSYRGPGYHYLREMIALCQRRNIPVALVEMPCWKEAQDLRPHQVIRDTAISQKPIWVLNGNNRQLCDSLLDPAKDWLSRNHLNLSGSVKFTGYLLKQMPSCFDPL
jgi:hypothetical protein